MKSFDDHLCILETMSEGGYISPGSDETIQYFYTDLYPNKSTKHILEYMLINNEKIFSHSGYKIKNKWIRENSCGFEIIIK